MAQNSDQPAALGRGIFITFEGGEGAGKTTHIRFLSEVLSARGYEVVCLREPGGTAIGERLRKVVLDPANGAMSDECELLIYEAARAQIVSQVIKPALERGAIVLCDRFSDSTIAYQAYGRGLSLPFVEQANAFACQGVVPHRTILLVAGYSAGGSAHRGLARATRRGADRVERAGEEFHKRVNEAFLEAADREPQRIRVVRSCVRRSETAAAVFRELSDLFPWMADASQCGADLFAKLDARQPHRSQHKGRSGRGAPPRGGKDQAARKDARPSDGIRRPQGGARKGGKSPASGGARGGKREG